MAGPSEYSGQQPPGWRRWRRAEDHAQRAPATQAAIMHRRRQLTAAEWAYSLSPKLRKAWRRHYSLRLHWSTGALETETVGYTCSAYCAGLLNIMELSEDSSLWPKIQEYELRSENENGWERRIVSRVDVIQPSDVKHAITCKSCGRQMTAAVGGKIVPMMDFRTEAAAKVLSLNMEIEKWDAVKLIRALAALAKSGVTEAQIGEIIEKMAKIESGDLAI